MQLSTTTFKRARPPTRCPTAPLFTELGRWRHLADELRESGAVGRYLDVLAKVSRLALIGLPISDDDRERLQALADGVAWVDELVAAEAVGE